MKARGPMSRETARQRLVFQRDSIRVVFQEGGLFRAGLPRAHQNERPVTHGLLPAPLDLCPYGASVGGMGNEAKLQCSRDKLFVQNDLPRLVSRERGFHEESSPEGFHLGAHGDFPRPSRRHGKDGIPEY